MSNTQHGKVRALVEQAFIAGRHMEAWELSDGLNAECDGQDEAIAVREAADKLDADLRTVLHYVLRQSVVFRDGEYPPHIQAALRLQRVVEGKGEGNG